MKQYQGAVFFIDMLGVGALTQNQIPLSHTDFDAWSMTTPKSQSANLLCGRLLTVFRSCLAGLKTRHKEVKIAQLSDCAYIWGANTNAILNAARDFMWSSVEAGLLSRGGISYGEIVEPNKTNQSIGQFVLGGAVTRAVGLEKLGKGCRIFVDSALLSNATPPTKSSITKEAFRTLRNPLDGSVVTEFPWYASGGQDADWTDEPHEAAKNIILILTLLQYSPRFGWNSSTPHGRVQLACSIDSVSSATPDFIGNGNYLRNADDILQQLSGNTKRSELQYLKILGDRLADIDRFFLDGKQKPVMQQWLERKNPS